MCILFLIMHGIYFPQYRLLFQQHPELCWTYNRWRTDLSMTKGIEGKKTALIRGLPCFYLYIYVHQSNIMYYSKNLKQKSIFLKFLSACRYVCLYRLHVKYAWNERWLLALYCWHIPAAVGAFLADQYDIFITKLAHRTSGNPSLLFDIAGRVTWSVSCETSE